MVPIEKAIATVRAINDELKESSYQQMMTVETDGNSYRIKFWGEVFFDDDDELVDETLYQFLVNLIQTLVDNAYTSLYYLKQGPK